MALKGLICAVPTPESWQYWSQHEMELSWRIPNTVISSVDCLNPRLSGTWHGYRSVIRFIPECVIWLQTHRWRILFFIFSITEETSMFTWSVWMKHIVNVLYTIRDHPIWNLFWQYPFCNVYLLWEPDELHQLLLGLGKDLSHWLLKYFKARIGRNDFDNIFTLVLRYPDLQLFSKSCNSLNSIPRQWNVFWSMIRMLAVNYGGSEL